LRNFAAAQHVNYFIMWYFYTAMQKIQLVGLKRCRATYTTVDFMPSASQPRVGDESEVRGQPITIESCALKFRP
jgi:hypothetical protein